MPIDLELLVRGRKLGREGRGRFLRESAGISVRELAAAVGVDVATLSRWERGATRPRQPAAQRWVQACDAIERELNRRDRSVKDDGLRAGTGGRQEVPLAQDSSSGDCTDEL